MAHRNFLEEFIEILSSPFPPSCVCISISKLNSVLTYCSCQNLADVSLAYGVQTFVYSSAMRMGPKYEDTLELTHKAKRNIENHCIELGEKGLNWTLVLLCGTT